MIQTIRSLIKDFAIEKIRITIKTEIMILSIFVKALKSKVKIDLKKSTNILS